MALARFREYDIARATIFDARGLHRFEKEIFPKDAYQSIELAIHFLLPRSKNYKVVTPSGQIVAFGATLDNMFVGRPAWIVTLGTALAFQRQGIARFLLNYCEQRLTAETVRLTVRAGNMPAIKLYREMGYRYMRRFYRYYHDGEDGLIFEKALR